MNTENIFLAYSAGAIMSSLIIIYVYFQIKNLTKTQHKGRK